jgi:hypothetical protein
LHIVQDDHCAGKRAELKACQVRDLLVKYLRMSENSMVYARAGGKLALLSATLLLVSGCEIARYARLPDPRPEPFCRAPIAKVMDEMDQRRNSVNTVVARLNIVLKDEVTGKEQTLWGAYLGDKQGNMRMRVKYQEKLLLDLSMFGDRVDLALPMKGKYYRGTRADVGQTSGNELALLVQVGNVHDLFFPRAWTDNAVERRVKIEEGCEVVSVMERPSFVRRKVRQLVISPENPVAQEMKVFDQKGQPIGTVVYNDYRFPGPRAGETMEPAAGVPYPGRLTLEGAEGKRSMRMEIEEMNVNTPVESKHFDITVPEDGRVENLGEVLRSGKSPW